MVDPQHPLEVQAQTDGVIVRHESLEAGVEVGGCMNKGDEEKNGVNTHRQHWKMRLVHSVVELKSGMNSPQVNWSRSPMQVSLLYHVNHICVGALINSCLFASHE